MIGQNGMGSASHLAVFNIYLCIIEEMLTVFKTPTMIQKLLSAYMRKVSMLSLKDGCLFMVEGVLLNAVTKPAWGWLVLCPSIYSLPLLPLKEGLYNPVDNSSQWTEGEEVSGNVVRFRLQTCITRKLSLSLACILRHRVADFYCAHSHPIRKIRHCFQERDISG